MHDAQTWEASRELVAQRYPRGADQLLGSLSSRFSPVETKALQRKLRLMEAMEVRADGASICPFPSALCGTQFSILSAQLWDRA